MRERLDRGEHTMSGIGLRLVVATIAGVVLGDALAFGQAQAPAGAAPTQAAPAPPPAAQPPAAQPPAAQAAPAAQPAPAAGTPAAPPPASSPEKKSLTLTSRSTMTKWKWEEVKAKWAREKGKWADCRSQAKEQKLRGPKSWHFMADCMIKVAHPRPAEPDKISR
jgi:hypothetical protein